MPSSRFQFWHPRYWPIWLGYTVMCVVVRLPTEWRVGVGRWVGSLAYKIGGERRRIVEVNISLCFPELDGPSRDRLVRDVFVSGGISITETALAWLGRLDAIMARATVEGLAHLNDARARGKGVILLGMHMSTLDLGGAVASGLISMDVMYRRNKNRLIEKIMTEGRMRLYPHAIERTDVRGVIANLKAGHNVWYGPDQDYGRKNSVFAPFFGVSTATTTAASRIARITGAAVVPFTHYRYDNNTRCHVMFWPALEEFPSASAEADAARINTFIERCVREHPEQYWWFHRRFKTRPEGEPELYKGQVR